MLYLVCGVAGSGKSFFIKEKPIHISFQDFLIETYKTQIIIDDFCRYESNLSDCIDQLINKIDLLSKNKTQDVYLEMTLTNRSNRKFVLDKFKEEGYSVTLIYFLTDLKVCSDRLFKKKKDFIFRSEFIKSLYLNQEYPLKSEGFHDIIFLTGNPDKQ